MEFKKYSLVIVFLTAFVCVVAQSSKRCSDFDYHEKCYTATKSILDDYIYLKSRPLTTKAQGMKFTINLKKNTLYIFNICEGESAKVNLKLFNEFDESLPIASTYNLEEKRYRNFLSIYPSASGKYSISIVFSEESPSCVTVVQGMIRKNIETYIKIPNEL